MIEQNLENTGAEKLAFILKFQEAVYGLHAYKGRDRLPAIAALQQLRATDSELYTALTMQAVNEMGGIITNARTLGVSLADELRIRQMGYRVLAAIPGLNITRRPEVEIQAERAKLGLGVQEIPNPKLIVFLENFAGSLEPVAV